jgi:hypothetical protein
MKRMAFVLALGALLTASLPAEKVSRGPRELGVVVLQELVVKEDKVIIRVDSGGCTSKSSIKANIQKEKGLTERAPHFVVTFERVRIDECKALLSEGVLIEYDIPRDLGLAGMYTLAVTNWVFPRSEESIVDEMILKRSLLASTARAIEMEIRGCEEKQKTADSGVGPAGNSEKFKNRAAALKGQLEAFRKMEPFNYPLPSVQPKTPNDFADLPASGPVTPPQKKTVTVVVKEPYKEGSLLDVEGMTKSGPFYHVVGGDFGRLKVGQKYELTVYLVFKRDAFGFIPEYYVHIADTK